MQTHLSCVLLLLCFTCSGLYADMEQEQQALGEQLLSSLFSSRLKQASKQSAPYWRVSLDNLCRLAGAQRRDDEEEDREEEVEEEEEEAWWRRRGEEDEEEDEEGQREMMMMMMMRQWSHRRMEELQRLQHICRAMMHSRQGRLRHDSREYVGENVRDAPLKRKSPYILKRQATHAAKSRRPYILKRSEIY
ncbi:uncharacterized protein nts [Syngnathoides biaculeatus]|uniref:uncharacterized protein nts n=1 Tax=Syngnathoides biaculeatus TaxID=300417 RepID=UPI002ADE1982|nr:uncharacterized protein nts [Syngnathoides biaculeatus]XP_061679143.1 uncharacterized protein nts [Syngnathoides biaculeatus]XP_061679144.1 uncharacterized protein nts [Syngnathoides biaculeatus]XP_061679145.1 uncharacterized protein nts [Syngnathoides biaculeatus]XP_061679146.1 uncharacterized protein nts [Syngnathoides biaculeatus]XP_061679147.1 uncharacterized protein nts [Syngnathoides biaculeatus]XP_061679148.1 uncharacterized protein nts [Syngnathoides biaculeatus]XP_061679149.1 unc